jgi:tripartite-type tricarboxylate transporter receptor subunit TctC
MKKIVLTAVLFLMVYGISIGSSTLQAQPYPNRPIQLIIPIPAGGGGDVNGRLLVEDLTKILGQQIVVVNKPGASDTLGTDALAKSKKDGYTLGYTSSAAMVFARVTNPGSVPTIRSKTSILSVRTPFSRCALRYRPVHRGRHLMI